MEEDEVKEERVKLAPGGKKHEIFYDVNKMCLQAYWLQRCVCIEVLHREDVKD